MYVRRGPRRSRWPLMRDGVVRNAEYQLRRRDEVITVVENARVVRDERGEIIGHEGTIADISVRKQAEVQLEEGRKAQVTLESIGDAVITADAEGRVEYLNPSPSSSRAGIPTRPQAVRRRGDPAGQRVEPPADREPDRPLPARGHG